MLEWLMATADPTSNLVNIFTSFTCGYYWGEKLCKALGWR